MAKAMTRFVISHTISSDPRSTPQRIFENHSSSCARPSSGSSTKSASGFSSKIRENWLLSFVQLVTVGVTFKKILKPTWLVQCQSELAVSQPRFLFILLLWHWTAPIPSTHLRNHISRLTEIGASSNPRLGQEILNQPHPNIVPHLLQLFVHFLVVAVIILA